MTYTNYEYDLNDKVAIFVSSLEVAGQYTNLLPDFIEKIKYIYNIPQEERDLLMSNFLPNAVKQILDFGKISSSSELSLIKSFFHKIIKSIPYMYSIDQNHILGSVIPQIFNSKANFYVNNKFYTCSNCSIHCLYDGMIKTLRKYENNLLKKASDCLTENNMKLIISIYSNISKSNLSSSISNKARQECTQFMTDFLQQIIHEMNNSTSEKVINNYGNIFDTFCDFLSPFDKEKTAFFIQIFVDFLDSFDFNFQKFGAHCISRLCENPQQANYVLDTLPDKSLNYFLTKKNLSSMSISELEPFLEILIRQNENQLNALFDILNSILTNPQLQENEAYSNILARSLLFFNHDLISVFVSTFSNFLHPFFFQFAVKAILALQQKDAIVAKYLTKTLINLAFVDENASSSLLCLFDQTKNNCTKVASPIAKIVLNSMVPLLRNGCHQFKFAHNLIKKIINSSNEPNRVFDDDHIKSITAAVNNENRPQLLDLLHQIFLETKKTPDKFLLDAILLDQSDETWDFLRLMITNRIIQFQSEFEDIFSCARKQNPAEVSPTFVRFLKVLVYFKNKNIFVSQNQIENNIHSPFKISASLDSLVGFRFIFQIYQTNNNVKVEKKCKNYILKILENSKFQYAVNFLADHFKNWDEINEKLYPIIFKSLSIVKQYLQIAETNYDPEDNSYSRHSYPENLLCLKVKETPEFNIHIDPLKTLRDLKTRIARRTKCKYDNISIKNLENENDNDTLFECGLMDGSEISFWVLHSSMITYQTIDEPPSLVFHRKNFESILLRFLDNINSEQIDSLIMDILNTLPDSRDEKELIKEKKKFIEKLRYLKNINKKKYYLDIIIRYDDNDDNKDNILKHQEGRNLIYSLSQQEELRDEAIKIMNKYYHSDEMNDFAQMIALDLLSYVCHCQKDEMKKEIFELLIKLAEKNDSLADLCDSNSEEIMSVINNTKVKDWDQMISFLSKLNRDEYFINLVRSEMKENKQISGFYLRILPQMIISQSVSEEIIKDIYSKLVEKLLVNDDSLPDVIKTVGCILEVIPKLVDTDSAQIPIDNLLLLSFGERYTNIQSEALELFFTLMKIDKSCVEKINHFILSLYILKQPIEQWNYSPSMYIRSAPFSGLRNLGATCFLNSVLQQLFHFFPIRYKLAKHKFEPGSEIITLQKLFMQMNYTKKPYCDTSNFIETWTGWNRHKLSRKEQQDAVEFFLSLLDTLPGEVTQLFKGQITNYIEGVDIELHGLTKESFLNLSISIKGHSNIESSLKEIIQVECIDFYQYEELKQKIKVRKHSKITQTPPILAIQLKRFEYDFKASERYKVNDKFVFPLQIDIQNLCATEEQTNDQINTKSNNDQTKKYDLAGMVIHSGIASIGHYKSIIRKGDEWWSFNDAEVSKMSEKEVFSDAFGEKEGTSAYILFYVQSDFNENDGIKFFKEDFDFSSELNQDDLEAVRVENDIFLETQATFNSPVMDFVQKIQDPLLNIAFYINILCHSKHTSKADSFSSAVVRCVKESGRYAESIQYLIQNVQNIINNYVNCSQDQFIMGLNKIILNILDKVEPNVMFDFLNDYIDQVPKIESMPYKQIPAVLKIAEIFVLKATKMAAKYGWLQRLVNILNYIYGSFQYNQIFANIDLSSLFNMIYNILNESELTDMTPLLKYSTDILKSNVSNHTKAYYDILIVGIFKHDLNLNVIKDILSQKDKFNFNSKVFPYFVTSLIECSDFESMHNYVNSILESELMNENNLYSKMLDEVQKHNKKFIQKLIDFSPYIMRDALLNKSQNICKKSEDIYKSIIEDHEFSSSFQHLLENFLLFFDSLLSTEDNLLSYYPQKAPQYSYYANTSEYRFLNIIKIIGKLAEKTKLTEDTLDKLINFIEILSSEIIIRNISDDAHVKELASIIKKLKINEFKEKKTRFFMVLFDRIEKIKDENVGAEMKHLLFGGSPYLNMFNENNIEIIKTKEFQRLFVRFVLIPPNGNIYNETKLVLEAFLRFSNSTICNGQLLETIQNIMHEIIDKLFQNEKSSCSLKKDILNLAKSNPSFLNSDLLSSIINNILKNITPNCSINDLTSILEIITSINFSDDIKSIEFDAEYIKTRLKVPLDKNFFRFVLWLYRHSSEIYEKKDKIVADLIIPPFHDNFVEHLVNFCFVYQKADVLIDIYKTFNSQDRNKLLMFVNEAFKPSSMLKKDYSSYDWIIPFYLNFEKNTLERERNCANSLCSSNLSDDSILKIITKFEKDCIDSINQNSVFKRDTTSRFILYLNLFSKKQNVIEMYSKAKKITPEILKSISSMCYIEPTVNNILSKMQIADNE